MKQRDLFAVGMIAVIVAIADWFLTNIFINTPENKTAKLEIVEPYSSDFNDSAVGVIQDGNSVDYTRDANIDLPGTDGGVLEPGE